MRTISKSSFKERYFDTFSKCNKIEAILAGNFGGKGGNWEVKGGQRKDPFFHPVLFKVHEKTMDVVCKGNHYDQAQQ